MLESQIVMILITVSGGLQDAYTYAVRDHVFANAQTGNIVLLMGNIFHGSFDSVLRYIVPLFLFSLGVLATDQIRVRCFDNPYINWWQIVVITEAVLLAATAFILVSKNFNLIANSLVSFSCAMQLSSFGKVNGYAYASTMCIGNLRSTMNALFGKTTGSTLCDGYAAGKLFEQGVIFRNLEFVQYHPITIETDHKRMLISEAARGEGGRLYFE